MMAIWVMLLIFLIHDASKNNFAGEFSIISEEPSRKKMHLVDMSRLHEFECRLVCSSQTTYVYNIKNDKWSPSQEGNAHHQKKRQFAKLLHLFLWRPGELDCHVAAPASLPRLVADLIIKNKIVKIIINK